MIGRPVEQPDATWRWWEGVGVFLGALILSAVATAPVLALVGTRSTALLLSNVVFGLVMGGTVIAWLTRFHPGWTRIVGMPRRALREVAVGATAGLVLFPVIQWGIGTVITWLLELLSNRSVQPPDQLPHNLFGGRVFLAAFYVVVLAPAWEELFFRGVLFRALRDRYGLTVGTLGSAFAFGLVHYVPGGTAAASALLMAAIFFVGIGLAVLYEWRRNLIVSIAAHAVFNLAGLAVILAQR